MARYIFYNLPAFGHINPTKKMVKLLVEEGDEVIYYNNEEYRKPIESTGATFKAYAPEPEFDFIAFSNNGFHGFKQILSFTRKMLPTLIKEAEQLKPDAIFFDSSCFWLGTIVANKFQVPAIISSAMLLPPIKPHLFAPFQTMLPLLKIMLSGARSIISSYRDHRFLKSAYKQYLIYGSHIEEDKKPLTITHTSSYIQPFSDDFESNYCFSGPGFDTGHIPAALDFERRHKKLIYISLGTILSEDQYSFYQTCFEAFGNMNVDVVISIGRNSDVSLLNPIPENITVRNFVPQLDVLNDADLFVSHAGMNGVHESLYYGVPLLLFPWSYEQMINAIRIEQLKGGQIMSYKGISAVKLRECSLRVMNSREIVNGVARLRESLWKAGGAERAVQSIKDFIRKHASLKINSRV